MAAGQKKNPIPTLTFNLTQEKLPRTLSGGFAKDFSETLYCWNVLFIAEITFIAFPLTIAQLPMNIVREN